MMGNEDLEGLEKLPRTILGCVRWPAAEAAGLVSVGGLWMTPEGAEKFREHHRLKRLERLEREEGES